MLLDMNPTIVTDELPTAKASVTLRMDPRCESVSSIAQTRTFYGAALSDLSPEPRHRRFLGSPSELIKGMLRCLTDIDHRDHEAMIAIDEQTDEGVGVARYVRDGRRPTHAEVAVISARARDEESPPSPPAPGTEESPPSPR